MKDIVIEGEVIVALCFFIGLILGWYHAHKKGFATIEDYRMNEHEEGDICPNCGGIYGTPEPQDMAHPYYDCEVCAGGS